MASRDFSSDDRVLSTAVFLTTLPLTPVNPARQSLLRSLNGREFPVDMRLVRILFNFVLENMSCFVMLIEPGIRLAQFFPSLGAAGS